LALKLNTSRKAIKIKKSDYVPERSLAPMHPQQQQAFSAASLVFSSVSE
jgi:hypothetical protein